MKYEFVKGNCVVRGFKALTEDMRAITEGITYEIGKWYHKDLTENIYRNIGFCRDLFNIILHCNYNAARIFEVEVKGGVIDYEYDSVATDVKLVREISCEEFAKYYLLAIDEKVKHGEEKIIAEIADIEITPSETLKKIYESTEERYIKCRIANNPGASLDLLELMSEDDNEDVRRNVVENPNVTVDLLEKLSEDVDGYVREAVGINPKTPIELLKKIIKSNDRYAISGVAKNTNAPKELLEEIYNMGEKYYWSLTRNKNCPVDILEKLYENGDRDIKYSLLDRKNLPESIIRKLLEDEDPYVREDVGAIDNLPQDIVEKLANDEYYGCRWTILINRDLPIEILEKLAEDKNEKIKSIAIVKLLNKLSNISE